MGNVENAIGQTLPLLNATHPVLDLIDFDGTVESAHAVLHQSHTLNVVTQPGFLPERYTLVFQDGVYDVRTEETPENRTEERTEELFSVRHLLSERFKSDSLALSTLLENDESPIKRYVMKHTPYYFLLRLHHHTIAMTALYSPIQKECPFYIRFMKWYATLKLLSRTEEFEELYDISKKNVYVNRILFDPFSIDILLCATIRMINSYADRQIQTEFVDSRIPIFLSYIPKIQIELETSC